MLNNPVPYTRFSVEQNWSLQGYPNHWSVQDHQRQQTAEYNGEPAEGLSYMTAVQVASAIRTQVQQGVYPPDQK